MHAIEQLEDTCEENKEFHLVVDLIIEMDSVTICWSSLSYVDKVARSTCVYFLM